MCCCLIDVEYRTPVDVEHSSRFSGVGGDSDAFPQELDLLPTQRVPLCTILRYPFLPDVL